MLGNILRNRRKQKLMEEIETEPEAPPEAFVELVQMHREDGEYQAASRVAKRGAELHPDSERILQSRADMDRVMRDLEKERLRQKIDSYPNPILFARLAELYKADGEIEAAIQVCQTGISRFESYGGTYLVLGEICLESGDYAGARVHLEKAVEKDKYNYTALRLLAEVYMHLGMPDRAARRLEEILYFAPGDESIMEMLRRAREAAGEPGPGEEETAPGELVEAGEEPEAVMAGGEAGAQPKAAAGEREINEALRSITMLSGVRGAVLVDPYGLVIAAQLKPEVDEELAGAMITNIFRTVARSAEPMGIGSFEDGLIEGEGGNIHVMGVEDMILAVFADPRVKMGMLEKSLRDFVDRVLLD
jgi:predicted regulator of Ras-like GTPase activity (Roadblock/LC7/MglB family)